KGRKEAGPGEAELTCPICTDIYTDPVTLMCGHNYCQICITRTWDNQEEGESSCPECIKRYRVRPELKRNLRLRNITCYWIKHGFRHVTGCKHGFRHVTGCKHGSDMLLDVNTASDMLLDVNTASDMLLDVNTASDMLLDVNTASNDVSISEHLKTVSRSLINQRRPETPERFQGYQVLSSRSFSSGRHYWEVEVNESGGWRVGMTYPSIERSGEQSLIGNNNKSWGLQKNYNEMYYILHDSKFIQLHHSFSCHRLGLFLDYEAGRLSFYELCDPIRHLLTFTAAFTEPLHAGFWVCGIIPG
uniref:Uncharacterized protein n=1 Tax=Leptobrachium leishanense TaxID=445787 RepID=A0A8C5MIV3_9ANUR